VTGPTVPVPHTHRGAALITAMLVVTIVTMLVSSMLWDTNLTIRRAENILFSEQALQYALGAESWAMDILATDLRDTQVDHRNEVWATALPPLPIEGGAIEGVLEDMQGRFNLNNLVGDNGAQAEAAVEQFQRLLVAVGLDPALSTAVVDWIDGDTEELFPDGAEDDFYTGREPAYRPANVILSSPTELLAMGQFDVAAWRVLRPHVTALPPGTAINPNTATPAVLQSLSDTISPSEAAGLYEQASTAPFEDLAELTGRLGEGAAAVTVNSNYFRLQVRVSLGATLFTMFSLLERDQQGNVWPRFRTFYTE
jgi:general secretion pathway protein K